MRRRKTFTGCWTCRNRRTRCDETKPICKRCREKGLVCEGYSTKLQWVNPASEDRSHQWGERCRKGSPRRRVLPAVQMMPLSDKDIENALSRVDRCVTSSIESSSVGPFSAFRLPARPSSLPTTRANTFEQSEPSIQPEANAEALPGPENATDQAEEIISSVTDEHAPFQAPDFHHDTTLRLSPRANPPVWQSGINDVEDEWPSPSGLTPRLDGIAFVRNSVGKLDGFGFLTSRIKYLISNYAHNLIPVYCILEAADNPWKGFIFPRILQCCMELDIFGQSTMPRQALLYAILTTSAYNLQNVSLDGGDQQASAWGRVAFYYKGNALRLLESCLESSVSGDTSIDHDELLAAMLSMFTIDVISGDMATTQIHLKGCESLIRMQLEKYGDDLPGITKSLHKIFIYLRVMQQASSLLFLEPPKASMRNNPPTTNPAWPDTDPCPDDLEAIFGAANDVEEINASSFEMIFGICQSLVYLLRRTTRLVLTNLNTESGQFSPQTLALLECDRLEAEVLEYPLEKKIAILRTAPVSQGNSLIMEHYARAFHHALMIFWHCRIRKMHRRYMQPYIEKVVIHLEQVERIKQEFKIKSGHMLWPAFVAASQATEPDLRARFLHWFETMTKEGIGSSRISKDVLVDIWRQTPDSFDSTHLKMVNFVLT